VSRGCEVWGGVLTVASTGRQMAGPVVIDRTGCQPVQSSESGNLSLTKQ